MLVVTLIIVAIFIAIYGGIELLAGKVLIKILYGEAYLDAQYYFFSSIFFVLGISFYSLLRQCVLATGEMRRFSLAFWWMHDFSVCFCNCYTVFSLLHSICYDLCNINSCFGINITCLMQKEVLKEVE